MFGILSAHGLFSLARAFIGAVLVIYLMSHGIDFSVIAVAKAAQLTVSVLFNYPSGIISDKYGNKITILLACISEVIYFSLMMHPTNNTVILGEMFNGLGIALYTGAYEAWIFTHKKDTEDCFSLISRSAEMLFIATILSGVIGALFSQYSLVLSIIFMGVSCIVYVFTPEKMKSSPFVKYSSKYTGVRKLIKTADRNVVIYVVLSGMMQLIYQFWPIFFKSSPLSLNQDEVGFVFAGSMIMQWIFTRQARKINFNKKKYAISTCYIGIIITSLLTITTPYVLVGYSMIVAVLYCFFISFCSLTVNYYFSNSCDIYSGNHDESSMISLLDTSARCFGALSLVMVSFLKIQNVSIIWIAFPVVVLIISFVTLSKRAIACE